MISNLIIFDQTWSWCILFINLHHPFNSMHGQFAGTVPTPSTHSIDPSTAKLNCIVMYLKLSVCRLISIIIPRKIYSKYFPQYSFSTPLPEQPPYDSIHFALSLPFQRIILHKLNNILPKTKKYVYWQHPAITLKRIKGTHSNRIGMDRGGMEGWIFMKIMNIHIHVI